MKNLTLNHHEVLKAIYSCEYTDKHYIITNTLNKEWDYFCGSDEVYEGEVVIVLGGVSKLIITFNEDKSISFTIKGIEQKNAQDAANFIINKCTLKILGREGFLNDAEEPNYGINSQYEKGLDNLADRSVYGRLMADKK